MDKKNILVKPGKITADGRAISLSFRYGTDLIRFIKILEREVVNLYTNYFYKAYKLENNLFIKEIGNHMFNNKKTTEEHFSIDLIIVALKSNRAKDLIKILDRVDNIISIYNTTFEDFCTKKED